VYILSPEDNSWTLSRYDRRGNQLRLGDRDLKTLFITAAERMERRVR